MSTVPYGNPAGLNQANPALSSNIARPIGAPAQSSAPTPAPIPGGGVPSSTNPYMIGTSSSVTPTGSSVPVSTAYDPGNVNLNKQWTDIYGQGTGSAMLNEYQGLQGANSAAYQALVQSMAPTFAQQKAQFSQTMGAGGAGPNSTVEALGLSNLLTGQGATLAGEDARMIMQNQQERLGLLQGTEQASAAEVAQSGWDVFGQVAQAIGGVAGAALGMPGISSLFGGGGGVPAGLFSPSVTGVNTQPELGPVSIAEQPLQTLSLG